MEVQWAVLTDVVMQARIRKHALPMLTEPGWLYVHSRYSLWSQLWEQRIVTL